MARINLLPWREWLREKRRKRYIGMLVALLVVTAAGLYVLDHLWTAPWSGSWRVTT